MIGGGPLVSAIMPFRNAELYIEEAVESVLAQSYPNWELIFVDDGSTDSSTAIARRYVSQEASRILYMDHEGHQNRGISASRNAGVARARGKYVAFLDDDDVWMPHRLGKQIDIMEALPEAVMVLGQSKYWYSWTGNSDDLRHDFIPDPGIKTDALYAPPELLLKLYPLGQATAPSMSNILVRRDAVKTANWFEEEFRGLYEDQAFLVKLYLQGHIFVSGECWDQYRIHPESCLSVGTGTGQYDSVRWQFLKWLERYLNEREYHDPAVRAALLKAFETRSAPQEVTHLDGWQFRVAAPNHARLTSLTGKPGGIRVAIEHTEKHASFDIQLNQPRLKVLADQQYHITFEARADRPRQACLGVAMAHEPWDGLGLYRSIALTPEWQTFDEEFVATENDENARIHFDLADDNAAVELASVTLRSADGTPAPGSLQFGTLRRVTPVSRMWGYDRGLPIDRYYIENYLARQSADIRGRVLEIEDSTYSRRFGGSRVTRSDVLHVVEGNPLATIVGDLTDAPQIPDNAFDCIVLTQTLQLIYDVRAAVRTLHRILRPGGVVLATFPGITQNNDRDWSNDWYWSFTPLSGKRLFEEAFAPEDIQISWFGNVLSAASFLYGISAGELTREELEYSERGYEVTIGLRAQKAGNGL